jgi:hypothetical protein
MAEQEHALRCFTYERAKAKKEGQMGRLDRPLRQRAHKGSMSDTDPELSRLFRGPASLEPMDEGFRRFPLSKSQRRKSMQTPVCEDWQNLVFQTSPSRLLYEVLGCRDKALLYPRQSCQTRQFRGIEGRQDLEIGAGAMEGGKMLN